MDKFEDILKRLINVITLGTVLTLVVTLINDGNSDYRNYRDTYEVCSLILAGVIAVNYIVFRKITLWHKSK